MFTVDVKQQCNNNNNLDVAGYVFDGVLLCCPFSYEMSCGWLGGAKVLGKLAVPGRPTIWITLGQCLMRLQ